MSCSNHFARNLCAHLVRRLQISRQNAKKLLAGLRVIRVIRPGSAPFCQGQVPHSLAWSGSSAVLHAHRHMSDEHVVLHRIFVPHLYSVLVLASQLRSLEPGNYKSGSLLKCLWTVVWFTFYSSLGWGLSSIFPYNIGTKVHKFG
jgi:hypothetical protein